jgi:hypothetical protein
VQIDPLLPRLVAFFFYFYFLIHYCTSSINAWNKLLIYRSGNIHVRSKRWIYAQIMLGKLFSSFVFKLLLLTIQ